MVFLHRYFMTSPLPEAGIANTSSLQGAVEAARQVYTYHMHPYETRYVDFAVLILHI